MPLDPILIIIIVSYLRKFLQIPATMPEWNIRFKWIIYTAIVLIALHFSFSRFNVMSIIVQWLSIALLAYLMYILYSNEKFKTFKNSLQMAKILAAYFRIFKFN